MLDLLATVPRFALAALVMACAACTAPHSDVAPAVAPVAAQVVVDVPAASSFSPPAAQPPQGSIHVATFDNALPESARLVRLLRAAELEHTLLPGAMRTELHVPTSRAWDAASLLRAAFDVARSGPTYVGWLRSQSSIDVQKVPRPANDSDESASPFEMVCGHSEQGQDLGPAPVQSDIVPVAEVVWSLLDGMDCVAFGTGGRSVQVSVPADDAVRVRAALLRAQCEWKHLQSSEPDRWVGWMIVVNADGATVPDDTSGAGDTTERIESRPVPEGRVRVAVRNLNHAPRAPRPLLALKSARCSPASRWVPGGRLGDLIAIDVPLEYAKRARAVLAHIGETSDLSPIRDGPRVVAHDAVGVIGATTQDRLQQHALESIARLPVDHLAARAALQRALVDAPASWFILTSPWGESVWAAATDAPALRVQLHQAAGHERGDYTVIERRE